MPDGQSSYSAGCYTELQKLPVEAALPMASSFFPVAYEHGLVCQGAVFLQAHKGLPPAALKAHCHLSGHPPSGTTIQGLCSISPMLSSSSPFCRLQAIPPAMDGSGKTAMPGESHPRFPCLTYPVRNAPRTFQTPHPPHRNSFPTFPHTVPLFKKGQLPSSPIRKAGSMSRLLKWLPDDIQAEAVDGGDLRLGISAAWSHRCSSSGRSFSFCSTAAPILPHLSRSCIVNVITSSWSISRDGLLRLSSG